MVHAERVLRGEESASAVAREAFYRNPSLRDWDFYVELYKDNPQMQAGIAHDRAKPDLDLPLLNAGKW